MYIWIVLRLFQAVDAHSGYDFPWSLQHIFPLWSGADHHDYHHEAFVGCYSTSFRIWDHLFNTEGGYRAKRKAQKAAKLEAKNKAQIKKAM
jgi:methylsterol monooxygenase